MRIKDKHDAFGHIMYDYLHGKPSYEIIKWGVKDERHLSITQVLKKLGLFDTILMIKKYISEWLDFLLVSPDELHDITAPARIAPTPWKVSAILAGEAGIYCGILKKTEQTNGQSI